MSRRPDGSIFVPCLPVAQPRQRLTVIAGRPHNYTPSRHPVNTFKAHLRQAVAEQWQGPPLCGPVHLELSIFLPRPKAKLWKRKPMPAEPHCKRPDLDNLLKAVLDALRGLVWRDDAQVAELVANKQIAAGDRQPGVSITIHRID